MNMLQNNLQPVQIRATPEAGCLTGHLDKFPPQVPSKSSPVSLCRIWLSLDSPVCVCRGTGREAESSDAAKAQQLGTESDQESEDPREYCYGMARSLGLWGFEATWCESVD